MTPESVLRGADTGTALTFGAEGGRMSSRRWGGKSRGS